MLRVVPVIIAAAVAVACSSGDEPDTPVPAPGHDGAVYKLGFYLTVGGEEGQSRATPTDGEYDGGEGYENHIGLSTGDYRFFVFSTDDKLLYAVTDGDLLPIQSTPGSKTYQLLFEVKEETGLHKLSSFKIVALANWGTYPEELTAGVTTLSDIVESAEAIRTYNTNAPATLGPGDLIPMYGVNQFDNVTLRDKQCTMLGSLHLLRAYAKIEVYDAPSTTRKITAVEVVRYNARSMAAPRGVNHQSLYVKGSYTYDYTNGPSVPTGSFTDGKLTVKRRTSDGHFVIYVPEYRNRDLINEELYVSRLRVHYSDRTACDLDFKYYNDPPEALQKIGIKKGDRFDLMRNNWYKFELNMLQGDLLVRVVPYAGIDLYPTFGLGNPDDWALLPYQPELVVPNP